MRKILKQLEEFFPLLKNTTLPAMIFAFAVLFFYAGEPFSAETLYMLNTIFYLTGGIIFIALLIFNRSKPAFILLISLLSYIIINILKHHNGSDFITTAAFQNLTTLAIINYIIFYFLPEKKFFKSRNIYALLFILLEFSLIEHLSRLGIRIIPVAEDISNQINLLLCGCALLCLFISCSYSGGILDTGLFFAIFNYCLGFAYSGSASGQITFFCAGTLTLAITLGEHIYYTMFHDLETGLSSRKSFMHHAKSFPPKYSLGIILIDDYERLKKIFKRQGIRNIVKMLSRKINEVETEAQIYRYEADEFVLIFRGETQKEAFERLEKIRRAIASSSFSMRSLTKPLKLTVSGAVTEQKRSDGSAIEVLLRADKALQKSYRFAQNITTKA